MDESTAKDLQVFRFSTSAYRPHERVDAWREVFGRTVLRIDITPRSTEEFRAAATATRFSSFGLISASMSAAHQANSRELIVSDDVSFGFPAVGRCSASQLGRTADLHPGDGVLMSNGDLGAITFPDRCRFVAFCIPRSAISPLVPDIDALFAWGVPASNPALQMLTRYLELGPGLRSPDHVGA
jgi:hypothetical protein